MNNWTDRRAFLEALCNETGGRMGVELADELDALRAQDEEDEGAFCDSCGARLSEEDIDGGRCTTCGTMLLPVYEENLFTAEAYGDGALDDLVHDVASMHASAVNNGGFEDQVQYLLENGWTKGQIQAAIDGE